MTTKRRHWVGAFIPGNSATHTHQVAQILREQGYEVSINDEDDYIYYMEHPLRPTYSFDDEVYDSDDINDNWYIGNRSWVAQFLSNYIGYQTIRLLDAKFSDDPHRNIGKYTVMPFPKEKKHDNTNA